MTVAHAKVLLIDDDLAVATSLQEVLEGEGFRSETSSDADQGLARAQHCDFDVVVTDLQMPGSAGVDKAQGLRIIRELHTVKPHLPVILMTAHHTTDTAIEATKLGAFDYLLKPVRPPELVRLVRNAAKNKYAASEWVAVGVHQPGHDAILGKSRVMQEVYKEMGRVAATHLTVLVRGETGTGKELVARALYQHSRRVEHPFVVVNCAALPETLLESELFGHEAGAFTDAKLRRIGRFEQAHSGTIFLDEIGDMSLSTQVKLLRVVQEKTIQRLGGKETIPVDVRILAATHRDLEAGIRAGTFRADLYFRISEAVIRLPPLRVRLEDIPELTQHILEMQCAELGVRRPALDPQALQHLQTELWPGNVRQLQSALRSVLLSSHGQVIHEQQIREVLAEMCADLLSSPQPLDLAQASFFQCLDPDQPFRRRVAQLLAQAKAGRPDSVESLLIGEAERELYTQAIQQSAGNQSQAARWLGISRPTLREKLLLYGLNAQAEGSESELLTARPPKVLVIEDEPSFAELLRELLHQEGYVVQLADSQTGLDELQAQGVDVVLAGIYLRGFNGMDLVRHVNSTWPHLPVILMTRQHTTNIAIQAIKAGAYDYLPKPEGGVFESMQEKRNWIAQLAETVDQAVASRRVLETVRLPGESPVQEQEPTDRMLGKSELMREVYKKIGRVAATNVTVLIRGETGTGKELVARALYQHSRRAEQPFVVVNCAALPETLLESELFGHEAGAFTDAKLRRIGRFEQAQGGTIFLDEIGDMSLSTQVKLLRVVQEKTIQRLGGKETIPVDVRILAATHRDLEAAIREGTFRADLYFRVTEAVIGLPALRERKSDIAELAAYFVQRDSRDLGWPVPLLGREAVLELENQRWLGNVRELRNVIRRVLLLARGYPITPDQIARAISPLPRTFPSFEHSLARDIRNLLTKAARGQLVDVASELRQSLERELYTQAIELAEGDQSQAARWLGISRPTMREKLARYAPALQGLKPPEALPVQGS